METNLNAVSRLKKDLRESNFSPAGILELTSLKLGGLQTNTEFSALRNFVSAADSLDLDEKQEQLLKQVSFFMLGKALPVDDFAVAFPKLGKNDAVELGIATEEDGILKAQVSLNLVDSVLSAEHHFIIFSDLDDHLRTGLAAKNHVMGVGGATKTLLQCVPTKRGETALDLGTGNGIVALELAGFYDAVTATDISDGAINFAKMNAVLNGVQNIEFIKSDLFENVAGRSFDAIITNPPFVIAPVSAGQTWEYRSSGREGDALFRQILGEAVNFLKPGGIFVSLGNWELKNDSPVETEPAEAIQTESGRATWVVERGTQTPQEYVDTWLRDSGSKGADQSEDNIRREWIQDFLNRDVKSITYGYVFMLKDPQAHGLTRHDESNSGFVAAPGFGNFWLQMIKEAVLLHPKTSAEILELGFVRAENVYERRLVIPGTDDLVELEVIKKDAPEFVLPLTTLEAALIGVSDGELNLGQIAGALAELMELDESFIRAELVTSAKKFVWYGILSSMKV